MKETQDANGGVVYVEFLVAFMPIFIFFLALVQIGFIVSARFVVQHAAIAGVRSAIVVLEDDKKYYQNEPYGSIDENGSAGGSKSAAVQGTNTVQKWFGIGSGKSMGAALTNRGGPRLNDIRFAAYMPLLAIAPSASSTGQWLGLGSTMGNLGFGSGDSLYDAIGTAPVMRLASGFLYNKVAAAITFPTEPGSEDFVEGLIEPKEKQVTVRVTYLYPCTVPLVSLFMCKNLLGFTGASDFIKASQRRLNSPNRLDIDGWKSDFDSLSANFEAFKQTLAELMHAEQPWLLLPIALRGIRFSIIRAEATLPNQGADYYRDK